MTWILSMLLLAQGRPQQPAATAANAAAVRDSATKARLAGRLDEAALKYRQALQSTPGWAEGWYFLGTIHYEKDRPKECAESFARFVKIQPRVSAAFALMGLCLFQTKDYSTSLAALTQAEKIGLPQGEQLSDVASYHAAMLFTRDGNFEKALQITNVFSRSETIEPKLIELAGIAALRKPIFPADLPADDRELVFRVGRAVMTAGARRMADATRLFEDLISDFPTASNLRYVYGNLLLGSDPDAALRQFDQELKLQPEHLPSLVVMGLEYVRQNRFAEARPVAEKAVRIAPVNFTAHTLLGRTLAEGDLDVPGGVAALEKAVELEPGSPQVRIALAAAYAKAGRREDAARQRAEFLRLKKILEGNSTP